MIKYMYKIILFVILDIICVLHCQDVTERCKDKCKQLSDNSEDSSWTCDSSCRVVQCDNGCGLWEKAVDSSCLDTCSESPISTKEVQHCIAGCNLAVDIYAQEVKDALVYLSSPQLVSKQNESVILKWEGEDTSLTYNVSRHLQKVVPGLVSEWQDHDNIEWQHNEHVLVKGLKPYTSYKFRLVIEIVNGRHSVESNSSYEITTKEYGVPLEAPTIVNLATASTSLHIKLKPPFYINAPLVGYEMNVTKVNQNSYSDITDIMISDLTHFEHDGMTKSVVVRDSDRDLETTAVITRLEPDTQYKVSVRLRNIYGIGPQVISYKRTKEANTEWNRSLLIYGADNTVLRQAYHELNPYPEVLFEATSDNITGLAYHYDQNKIFVSVTSGSVYCLELEEEDSHVEVIYESRDHPRALNVDWLNDKIYIAEDYKITQCSLTGEDCITAVDKLRHRPEDVKVDPGSGYLFWVQDGQGIYRRKLTRFDNKLESTQHSYHDPESDRIIKVDVIFSIAIDHINYRIFYANMSSKTNGNTLMSANFDGTDIMDIRQNVHTPDFILVESMTHVNRLFVWTNGKSIQLEEQDPFNKIYHHNQMGLPETHFTGLNIWHPSAQPTPVPFMAPRKLQVVFTEDSAVLTWDPPGNGQGEAGYNTWQYEIEEVILTSGINHTFTSPHAVLYYHIQHCSSGTQYSYRVRAISNTGKGPWCKAFVGTTLKAGSYNISLIMVDGENVMYTMRLNGEVVTDKDPIYIGNQNEKLQEFEKINGTVLWSSVKGHIYKDEIPVGNLNYTGTFAYDWIGNMLYWAPTRSTDTIRRLSLHNLVDNLSESVIQEAIGTSVQNLLVDAIQGYLYWTTQLTVEATRLDGRDYTTIFTVPNAYSGMYVMGITVNYDDGYIYWLLKTGDTTCLYKAVLFTLYDQSHVINSESSYATGSGENLGQDYHLNHPQHTRGNPEKMFDFHTKALPLKVEYYSHKLFWKGSSPGEIEILDLNTKSIARISLSTNDIQAFVIDYPQRYGFPDGLNQYSINVIPSDIRRDSIKLSGKWDDFNIIWHPPAINYGRPYYIILLDCKNREILRETAEPHLSYLTGFDPYTLVQVTLKACSSWGCSKPINTGLRTPMSAPSLPGRPRAYVTHHESISSATKLIELEFHWDIPEPANGVIKAYYVQVASNRYGPWGPHESVLGNQNYFVVSNAKNNSFYYFKVRACTQVECSDYTTPLAANTTVQKPVPKLLTTSANSINMFLPDEKEEAKRSLTLENDQVCAVTFIAREDTYFWLNKQGTIVRKAKEGNATKVVTTNNTSKSLTVDWVGRDLYWSEQKSAHRNTIHKYDLNKNGSSPTIVMSRVQVVWKLEISPYRSSLYWTESSGNGRTTLMSSDLEGSNPRSFFSSKNDNQMYDSFGNRVRRQHCTCTGVPISPIFVIDQSEGIDAELYFIEAGTKNIWASDLDGCMCRLVFNGTSTYSHHHSLGLPPDSMTIDQERIYWANSRVSELYSINKWTGEGLDYVFQDVANLGNLQNIVAYGDHLQPMPDTKCLFIESYVNAAQLLSATDMSLKLKIVPWTHSAECLGISAATGMYIVYYREIMNDDDTELSCDIPEVVCQQEVTFELEVDLENLKPFTHYMVQVAVTNYYMENRQRRPVFAPNVIFKTKTGVPSEAREVMVIATTPSKVNITWHSPTNPNAAYEDLIYSLHMSHQREDGSKAQGRYDIEAIPYEGQGKGMFYTYNIRDLLPSTLYYFQILVRTSHSGKDTASEQVWVRTYQLPNRIKLVNKTNSIITVSWKSSSDRSMVRHRMESKHEKGAVKWETENWHTHTNMNATTYKHVFSDRKPNAHYAFRISVVYRSGEIYVWPTEEQKKIVFSTDASLPAPPTSPEIENEGNGMKILVWNEPSDGGLKILQYMLYARTLDQSNWTAVYNGSSRRWIIDKLHREQTYIFSVAAKNELGWSNLSPNSSPHLYVPAAVLQSGHADKVTLILSVSFGMLVLLVVAMLLLLLLWKRYKDPKGKQFSLVNGFRHPTDMELATLREMPRVTMQSNALYAINIIPTDEGIAALPHFHREDLSLTKFLGSGAFGEVYEGTANNILSSNSGETKVAVKALKKGATDNEKEEFLKEALLMKNFQHDHILRLLGVCLHNDPQFIILELMTGGDLLTYLRASRSTPNTFASLELRDMVSICVDIAKGCKYLEELHFVHRDLAARNCLVADNEMGERVVKIGDFGLARDIYNSDYYRKEGEGLMPVRWMSPESLVDGIFTTHSDVWAFGVLIWETFTLGQQPYPARTNLDVLNYVRQGGRLDRPDNCPDDIYDLMLKCWYYNPDARPSFRSVLCQLETFKCKSQDPSSELYRKRTSSNNSSNGHSSKLFVMHHGETDSAKAKNLKANNVKRSFSFDMKGRFGIHPSSTRNSHEVSGYLEPLVPVGEENKYLELLGGNDPNVACIKCGRLGCDERCHRGLLRHSSDCTHSLRIMNKLLHQQRKEEGKSSSKKSTGKGKKGKKSKKCDSSSKVCSDSGSTTSGTGSGMESLPEDSADDSMCSNPSCLTAKGSRYHHVASNDSPWLVYNDSNNSRDSSAGSTVPGFLIHPPTLVKRTSYTPSEIGDSVLSVSIPPDFDELAPNNRSSVDSNSPLLTWGQKDEHQFQNDNNAVYQSGFSEKTSSSGSIIKPVDDVNYLRHTSKVPVYSLETSGESLV